MTDYRGTRDDRLMTRVPPDLGGWARQHAAGRYMTVSSLLALLLHQERQRRETAETGEVKPRNSDG